MHRRTGLLLSALLAMALFAAGLSTVLLAVAPADAASSSFTAVADAYSDATTPTTSFGTAKTLIVDASPRREIALRFAVAGVTGTVSSAKLRLHVSSVSNAGSPAGGTVYRSSSASWIEATVNWNSRPTPTGAALASFGAVAANAWYEVDVTAAVAGDGTFGFVLSSTNTDGAYYDAREAGANAPQLVVTTASPPLVGETLLAVGDIATCTSTGDEQSAAVASAVPGTVITLGDNVYQNGTAQEFAQCYDPSWGGALKARTRPSAGNHDYNTANATGYYGYFGAAAGDPSKGYYTFTVGTWRLIALNSNCAAIGGCGAGSPQELWLRQTLATSSEQCTLAYWHHPLFSSSSGSGAVTAVQPLYQALYDYNADLVLVGHAHNYERFAPQTSAGVRDDARGIREFVVGTGGADVVGFSTPKANSEVRNTGTFGVMKLTLGTGAYEWKFLPVAGKTFTDSGRTDCH